LLAETKINYLEKQQIERELQASKKEINYFIAKVNEHSNMVSTLEDELSRLKNLQQREQEQLNVTLGQLKTARILTDDDWFNFLRNFENIFPELTVALKSHRPALSVSEMRFLMLVQLNLSNKEMARAIGVSESGIRLTLSRVRKKLNGNADDTAEELLEKFNSGLLLPKLESA